MTGHVRPVSRDVSYPVSSPQDGPRAVRGIGGSRRSRHSCVFRWDTVPVPTGRPRPVSSGRRKNGISTPRGDGVESWRVNCGFGYRSAGYYCKGLCYFNFPLGSDEGHFPYSIFNPNTGAFFCPADVCPRVESVVPPHLDTRGPVWYSCPGPRPGPWCAGGPRGWGPGPRLPSLLSVETIS